MKKLISVLLVLVLAFCLSSCSGSNPYNNITDEQISSKVSDGDLGELMCYYSVANADRTDDEFLVHFSDDVYDEEKDKFYDKDGDTLVQFFGEKEFYDKDTGKAISEDDLTYGELLKVVYNGEIYDEDPITIKAVKVYVCD